MEKRLLAILCIIMLSLGSYGCGKSQTLTKDGFNITSTEVDSNKGSYQITIEFLEESPVVTYILYENNKEVSNDIKDKDGAAEFQFDISDKKTGTYIYKLTVKDEAGSIYEKEVEVKVVRKNEKDKVEETDGDAANNEEEEEEEIVGGKAPADENLNQQEPVNDEPTYNESVNDNSNNYTPPEEDNEPIYASWKAYTQYFVGDIVNYKGVLYKCRQQHTSLPDWIPTNVLSLWEPI